nr:hypothetical protein [Tanacetum cinerariifolium]
MEESLSKFMNKSAKRHEENSNLIKEILVSTDASIRNQGASINNLEIQIEKISKGSYGPQYLDACSYGATCLNDALPRKEKEPRSFTLPNYINNVCFENALADLGAIESVMPLLTYLNLGLGKLAHTKLTVELADRTVQRPKGNAENVYTAYSLYDTAYSAELTRIRYLFTVLNTTKFFKTLSLDESRSPLDILFDLKENSKEEVMKAMAKTMEQYMSKTRANYGSGIAKPKIDEKYHFELKGKFLKELRENTFSGSDHEDANEQHSVLV